MNEEEKMHARTRKSLYSRQVKQFLSVYTKARKNGDLSKMCLEENADKFAQKIEYLGDRLSYKLFLAEMYSFIGRFKEAREILSWYDKEDLTISERKQYENIEKGILIEENKRMIRRLCERGKNFQEILNECEKVGTCNRVLMDFKFIKEVMNQYKIGEAKKLEQSNKVQVKQEDEIER